MFKNLFKYYFKQNIRIKEIMFWNLAFPIALSLLMHFAFSNIEKADRFKTLTIGVESQLYAEILKDIEDEDGKNLFNLVESNDYESDIKSGRISGYLKGNTKIEAVLGNKIIDNTVIYTTANTINNKYRLIEAIMKENPNTSFEELGKDLQKEINHVDNGFDISKKSQMNSFFYTLVGMVCLGAASSGLAAVNMIQLRGGFPEAIRYNIVPISKFKILVTMLLAALLISLLQTSVVLIFMKFVLGVDFGSMYLLLINSVVFSSLFGLLIGAAIGLLINAKMDTQLAITIGVYVSSSFFAGMMSSDIRSIIASKAPLFARINPGTIIYHLFSSMYYFESTGYYFKYFKDLLIGIGVLVVLISILARRREYEHI